VFEVYKITAAIDGVEKDYVTFLNNERGNGEYHLFPRRLVDQETKELMLNLDFLNAETEDEGYYVIPNAKVCFLTTFTERPDMEYTSVENIMPIIGAKIGGEGKLVIIEGMPHNFELKMRVNNGRYSIAIRYDLTQIDLYEDIRLRVITLSGEDATYSGMARVYRKIQEEKLNLIPLAERVKTDEVLAYGSKDMPVIRIRMAWKPVPTPVLEQTLETEPPMHVACTFAQVEALIDEMKYQGIEKAEICLVGWNVKGHDGRWPQMFPVEEKLGGEDGLKKLIAHAKTVGYRIVCHTNSSDAYRIADCWDEGEIIKTKSGELSVNANAWSGGRMYNLCPKIAHEKYLQQNLPKVEAFGFEGFHYIDVLTIIPPRTCYDPEHPLTADQSADYLNRILQQTKNRIGGIASEGGYDFAAANLDFSLYIAYNLLDGAPEIADEIIPLWQLVYHGYVLSNPSAETVNYTIKPAENRLRFYEFGGIPVLYFYSRFVGENGMKNWMGDQDLYCATEEQRQESVRQMKLMMEDYQQFADRTLAFMEDHRKLADGVYETVYSDGVRIVVNYTDKEYQIDSVCVPPKNLIRYES